MATKQAVLLDDFNRVVDEDGRRKKANEYTRAEVEALNALHPIRARQTKQMRDANTAAKQRRALYALDRGVSNRKSKTPPAGWRPSRDLISKLESGEVVLHA